MRDRRYPVLFWAAAAVVSEGVLLLFRSPAALQIFLLAIWAAAGAGILAYDYGRKRSFYDGLRERLGQLDEKYLVIEMLREPRFLEGKILYRSLGEILKSMNDEIGCHERISNAFRTYVETWVHEIKIPIAGAKLIMHNNPGESSRKLKEQLGKVEAYVQNRASFLLNRLADVAFKDDIVEYDTEEESITARLKLENDFEVSVTRFANESEVLYSLFHGRKLLICDEMPIESLVKSLNEVVAKLARV